MKSNKHSLSVNTIKVYMIAIIMLVILFSVVASLFPTLMTAGDTLNSSGFPLGEFFATGGAIWYILPLAIILILFGVFALKSKK